MAPTRSGRWQSVGTAELASALTVASCASSGSPSAVGEQRVTPSPADTSESLAPDPRAADTDPASPPTTDVGPHQTPATTTTLAPRTLLPLDPTVPTTVPLPRPIAAPLDDDAAEPVVVLGSLAIPSIGVDSTLHEGIRLTTFDRGPGHWPGSAMPGQIGNMVVGGHRTVGAADFRDLDQLQPGDEMIVTDSNGSQHTYVVDYSEITDPFAARMIHQTSERTATLFACHPPGSISHRIVVHLTLLA